MEIALPRMKTTRKERWAWYLYDFGNSAYASIVLLAVYSLYFKNQVVVSGAEGTRLWGRSLAIAMLVVAIISPVLGTIADFSGSKKRFLLFFTAMAVIFCGLLFFVQQGDIFIGMLFFILAEIGYRSAQVFYNGLLPEISTEENVGEISGNGWAVGAVGGVVCLLLVLALIMLIEGLFIVRFSMVITAVFFALSAAPVFLWLKERAKPNPLPEGENYLTIAFKRLSKTIKNVRQYREFVKFIIAFLIYNDGLLMTLNFAAILGAVLYGLEQQQIIIFSVLAAATSVPGAYLFGVLADRIGSKKSLLIALGLMIASLAWLYFNYSALGFYVLGAVAGFALSAVQSVSRTMVSLLSPPGQSAEFYGLFAVAGRTSSFIGPAVFGLVAAEGALWYERQGLMQLPAEQAGQRLAILSIIAFLVMGTVLLLLVNEKRGRALAAGIVEK